jgi:lysophospholipase L1-like esterase
MVFVVALPVREATAQLAPFVIFGDSISVGGNATRGNRTWVARLARKTTRYSILNYSRNAWSVCSSEWLVGPAYIEGMTALWPTAVLVALGTNDYAVGSPVEAFRVDYRNILERAVAWPFGAEKVFCLTPLSRFGEDVPNDAGLVLDDYRLVIEQECEQAGGRVLDGRAMMPNSSVYLADGLHPNDRGHREIAKRLWKELGDELR